MKSAVAILLAALLGFGGGWFVSSRQQRQHARQAEANEATWQNEKAFLEQSLAEANRRPASVRTLRQTVSTTVTNKLSPQEILERLKTQAEGYIEFVECLKHRKLRGTK